MYICNVCDPVQYTVLGIKEHNSIMLVSWCMYGDLWRAAGCVNPEDMPQRSQWVGTIFSCRVYSQPTYAHTHIVLM
jgi:hypothetical protein